MRRADTPGAIEIDGVGVSFGGVTALADVSVSVPPGTSLAVIGPNGAGKTTLLNCISGVLDGVTGEIRLDGVRLSGARPDRIASHGIARTFQEPHLIDGLTVRDNVLAGAHLRCGYGPLSELLRFRRVARHERELAAIVVSSLDSLGLSGLADEPVSNLPYGPRKLVDIARALCAGPRVLLLDEPTSGLDSQERAQLIAALAALRERRTVTLIMVEHHMDVVKAAADQVLVLQAGERALLGPPTEVLGSPELDAVVTGGAAGGSR